MPAFPFPTRLAIVRPKSGTVDAPDSQPRQMANWKDTVMRKAQEELENYKEFQKVQTYISMLDGEGYWPQDRAPWRSSFYDNYLADQRRESLASLSQVRPALEIYSKVEAFKHQGKVLHDYTRYLWSQYDLDLRIVSWLDHALFGTGFCKIVASEGDPDNSWTFEAMGLDSCMPILCNGDLQQSAAVVHRSYQGLPYFLSKFGPEKCIGLEREAVHLTAKIGAEQYQRPSDIPQYRWDALSPAFKRRASQRRGPGLPSGSDMSPFPVIELLEIYTDDWSVNEYGHDVLVKHPDLSVHEHNYHYIVPPGCRMFPRKRLTIFAGNRVMYDGPSPFWHGLYPFTMLQLNPCVWSPGGISKYRDLVPLVRAINRIVSGVDDSVSQALNRWLVGKRGSIPEAVWDALDPTQPGRKLLLNPIAQPGDVRWLDPPQVPAYVGDFLRYLVDNVKRRSGALDIQGLSRKKQAPGGEAIEQMRDSMSGPYQLEGRYLEAAIKRCGIQIVSNIFQFATLSSRMQILGADGMTHEDFDYDAGEMTPGSTPKEDHWKKFSVSIAAGSTHGNSRMQRKVEAFTMRNSGNLSMKGLFQLADVPYSYEQNIAELNEEHKQGIGVAPPKGRQPRQTRGQRNGSPL